MDGCSGILTQHHTVGRHPDGILIDVTPYEVGALHAVFADFSNIILM